MSDFEKYIEAKYPNRSPKILFQKFKDIDGTLFYGIKEVEDQAEAWKHQQAKIEKLENELSTTKQVLGNVIDMEVAKVDNLKTQLNNMEACYIEKKKEVEELQKTNISLEAGLRKNSKNKQKLLGKNIELQKRIDEYEKLTTSIRNEFDLWSDDSEFADVIEAQIENLEALRGEHENSN